MKIIAVQSGSFLKNIEYSEPDLNISQHIIK